MCTYARPFIQLAWNFVNFIGVCCLTIGQMNVFAKIFFSLYRHSLAFVYNCKDKNAAIKNLINKIKRNRNIFEMDKFSSLCILYSRF